MAEDIEGYLHSKGITGKRSGNHIIAHHPECADVNNKGGSKPGHWYINVSGGEKHGLWDCKRGDCQKRGNWRTLMAIFGDKPDETKQPMASRQRIITEAAKLYRDNINAETLEYLIKTRGLTQETIQARMLGYAPGGRWLYDKLAALQYSLAEMEASGLIKFNDGEPKDAFFNAVTIPYVNAAGCVDLRARIHGGSSKYLSLSGSEVRLYNSNTTWGADEVIICEGEFDAMVMEQLGYRAVAVPGANAFQQSFATYFEDAKRVWIMCDPDDAGIKCADGIEALLGPRSKIVRLPILPGVDAKKIDPTYLVGLGWNKVRFDQLLAATARESSLLRTPAQALTQFLEDEKVGGIKTGFDVLDRTLGGGIRRPNLVVPIARTNVGKTLFLFNLMMRMAMVPGQGDMKFLLLTLEQTGGEWMDRARRIFHYYHSDLEPKDVHQGTVDFWSNRMRYVEKNRLTEVEIRQAIEDFEVEMGQLPDVIFIDYLGYLSRGFPGAQTLDRVSAAAQSLKGIAKEINRPIVVPSQASRKAEHGSEVSLDDARDSGEIENTADIVFGMWSQDTMKGRNAKDRIGEMMMKILKSRGKGKSKEVKFFFAPLSLVWIPADEAKGVAHVKGEIDWDNDGDVTWQDAILAHRTGIPPKGRRRGAS